MFAEAVAVEDEPEKDGDEQRPQRLNRELVLPRIGIRVAEAADDPPPDARVLGAPQGIGFAAREHGRDAGPEELRAQRRDERGDADARDQIAVDDSDERAGSERRDDRDPAEVVVFEENGEHKPGKGDHRRERKVDLPRGDHEGQPGGEQYQRRRGRQECHIDVGRQKDLRRRIHEQTQDQREHHDDRQSLDLEQRTNSRPGRHGGSRQRLCCMSMRYSVNSATVMSLGRISETISPLSRTTSRSATSCTWARLCSM